MTRLARPSTMLLASGMAALLGLASTAPAFPSAAADGDTLQMIADATVIDAACRTTNTMYGAVFRYGDGHGVNRNDILLSGRRRREFENAMQWRLATTPREDICGSLQRQYRDALPDWFRSR